MILVLTSPQQVNDRLVVDTSLQNQNRFPGNHHSKAYDL